MADLHFGLMDQARMFLRRHMSSGPFIARWSYRLGALLRGRRDRHPLPAAGSHRLGPLFLARSKTEFDAAMESARFPDLAALREVLLAGRTLRLRRFCLCCGETTPMLVDLRASYQGPGGERTPNWREGLVCPGCGLNNRQRLMATLVRQAAAARASPRIYLMEQVTPIYEWVRRLPHTHVRGSEYLGPGVSGGTHVRGIRHEDAMALSWPDCSFDLIVSNDVLEHIPEPERALRECFRALAPGGTMLATFPFHEGCSTTVVRARPGVDGAIAHLLPAQYHGNPLSLEGSLVYQDFGWDLLERMADVGFRASCEVYASEEFGHVGPGLLVFRLHRPDEAGRR